MTPTRPVGAPAPPEERLLALPEVALPDPEALLHRRTEPHLPEGRPCGVCGHTVGAPVNGLPGRSEGFCSHCGNRYSLRPQLREGELLDDGRYEVLGPLAHGGLGWVYLAKAPRLRNRLVALKGMLNIRDPRAPQQIRNERDQMLQISHDSLVRIMDFVPHRPTDGRIAADYIVMEFVGGKSLDAVLDEARNGGRPFDTDEPLNLEHVARYGCQVLDALTVLHELGLVYVDMKPHNVIHQGGRVVLIDLGALERLADDRRSTRRTFTGRYASPQVLAGEPPTVPDDLYAVGATLNDLAEACVPGPDAECVGTASFHRVVARAKAERREDRFGSAAEMSDQLAGVLREMIALRTGHSYLVRSRIFDLAPTLLDGGLGAAPDLESFVDRDPAAYRRSRVESRPLQDGRPSPLAVAAGLPVLAPDPTDPDIDQLGAPPATDAPGVIRQLERYVDTVRGDADSWPPPGKGNVGVPLRLSLAYIQHAAQRAVAPESRRHRLDHAAAWLRLAEDAVVAGGPRWRVDWHQGLLHLACGKIAEARGCFDLTYTALPGEYAPKVALGYCAEHGTGADGGPAPDADLNLAARLYDAVWRRNNQQASAAFGLVRVHLRRGERQRAAEVLDRVPPRSRHHDAARIAAVRVRAARLPFGADPLPDPRSLAEAVQGFTTLERDRERDRGSLSEEGRHLLTAELREWALDWIQRIDPAALARLDTEVTRRHTDARSHLDEVGHGPLCRDGGTCPPTEDELRLLLSDSFRELAWLAGVTRAHSHHLEDCANMVAPRVWFHHRRTRKEKRR